MKPRNDITCHRDAASADFVKKTVEALVAVGRKVIDAGDHYEFVENGALTCLLKE